MHKRKHVLWLDTNPQNQIGNIDCIVTKGARFSAHDLFTIDSR